MHDCSWCMNSPGILHEVGYVTDIAIKLVRQNKLTYYLVQKKSHWLRFFIFISKKVSYKHNVSVMSKKT